MKAGLKSGVAVVGDGQSGDAGVGEKSSKTVRQSALAEGGGRDSKPWRRSAGAGSGRGTIKPGQWSRDAKVGKRNLKRGRDAAEAAVDRGNCQPERQSDWTPTKVHRLRFLKQTLYPVRCLAWEPNSKRLAVSRNEGGCTVGVCLLSVCLSMPVCLID